MGAHGRRDIVRLSLKKTPKRLGMHRAAVQSLDGAPGTFHCITYREGHIQVGAGGYQSPCPQIRMNTSRSPIQLARSLGWISSGALRQNAHQGWPGSLRVHGGVEPSAS